MVKYDKNVKIEIRFRVKISVEIWIKASCKKKSECGICSAIGVLEQKKDKKV